MQIQIIDKNEDSVRLKVEGISLAFANALRRIILSEVPTMAIDEVVILENSSVLHDEILALRFGFIPLRTDLDSYNPPEECSCRSEFGCNLCRAILTLDVEAKDDVRTVYSGEVIPDDPDITPVGAKIPIVKLAPGQRVRLEAYARLGKGKVHAKWQPASVCAHRYMPIVHVDDDLCDDCGECVEICPRGVLIKDGDEIKVQNLIDCTLCKDCVRVCTKDPSAIGVSWDEESLIFDIESNRSLSIERILSEALNILHKKFVDLSDSLSGGKNEQEEANQDY